MEWSEEGIVVGGRRHGEADAIIEVLTAGHGRHLGLVKGGRSRRLRPILQPGNTLSLTWRARLHEHLGNFRAEPVTERSAALMATPIGAFGLALAGAHLRLLPERDPHPRLYEALAALLDHLDHPALAAELMVRFELLLLDELGFGLDLESCAATGGREELVYVSPKSGRAVSRARPGSPIATGCCRCRRSSPGRPTGEAGTDGLRRRSCSPGTSWSGTFSMRAARGCRRCGSIFSRRYRAPLKRRRK